MAKTKITSPTEREALQPQGSEQPDHPETEHVDVKPANPQKVETAPNARRRDQAEDRRQSKTGPGKSKR